MVAVDANFLSLMLHTGARPPKDPRTGEALSSVRERMRQMLADLTAAKEIVLIPTPALSEFLVLAGASADAYLAALDKSKTFRVVAFDEIAAVELARVEAKARLSGDKRGGADAAWQKVKFDRQIAVCARVHGARRLFTDDQTLAHFARELGLEVVATWDLPLPPSRTPLLDGIDDE